MPEISLLFTNMLICCSRTFLIIINVKKEKRKKKILLFSKDAFNWSVIESESKDIYVTCDTENWSKDAENSALITGIN